MLFDMQIQEIHQIRILFELITLILRKKIIAHCIQIYKT